MNATHTDRRLRLLAIFAALGCASWSLAACDLEEKADQPECPADPATSGPDAPMSGTVTLLTIEGIPYDGEPLQSTGIEVEGRADHWGNLAIREVMVGDVPAEPLTFNFATWRAAVPFRSLASLLPHDGPDEVELNITAVDVCGTQVIIDSVILPVDRTPGIHVDELSIDLGDEAPSPLVLPADGSETAAIRVMANPEAAGATVRVEASGGQLSGTTDGEVVLAGSGGTAAQATLLYRGADPPGPVIITATSEGQLATALISVVGPPMIVPVEATLVEGESLTVGIVSDAELAYCQASPRAGVSITSGGEDLMGGPVPPEAGSDGTSGVFTVEAVGPFDEGAVTATVSCFDIFGQFRKARFYAEPGEDPGFGE